MRKIFIFIATALCIFASACEKTNDGGDEPVGFQLVSTPLEGSQFDAFTDTEMRFELVQSSGVLKMNKVKFAERMPRLDIEVPGVTIGSDGNFSIASIIPTYLEQPMAQYVMTDFKLSFDQSGNRLYVEFNCFTMHVEYVGQIQLNE